MSPYLWSFLCTLWFLRLQYSYTVKFNQVYVAKTVVFEADGEPRSLYPHEARLRSLTYSAPLFIDVSYKQFRLNENRQYDRNDEPEMDVSPPSRLLLAYVPIMLKSKFCILNGLNDVDLAKVGECVFDQGGYFVINGSEKVIIAQERMSKQERMGTQGTYAQERIPKREQNDNPPYVGAVAGCF